MQAISFNTHGIWCWISYSAGWRAWFIWESFSICQCRHVIPAARSFSDLFLFPLAYCHNADNLRPDQSFRNRDLRVFQSTLDLRSVACTWETRAESYLVLSILPLLTILTRDLSLPAMTLSASSSQSRCPSPELIPYFCSSPPCDIWIVFHYGGSRG